MFRQRIEKYMEVSTYPGEVMNAFSRDMKPRTQRLHDKMGLL
jgi:hypothetical protein